MHILKKNPFKTREAVIEALNRADPEGKEWTRQRVDYQVTRVFLDEQKKAAAAKKRPATRSPAESPFDNQEGFPVEGPLETTLGLNLEGMDLEEPSTPAPPANPLGGNWITKRAISRPGGSARSC